jgi:hypothetical protein
MGLWVCYMLSICWCWCFQRVPVVTKVHVCVASIIFYRGSLHLIISMVYQIILLKLYFVDLVGQK